ncbi:MAG: hypothetical protein A4E49_03060 [Methanosaeta sp. PtaU1.Bin112]|nr:MAG: hypothetical protein A4E49_03060 [Methanosaeta sp. PtaU1.Bin112]
MWFPLPPSLGKNTFRSFLTLKALHEPAGYLHSLTQNLKRRRAIFIGGRCLSVIRDFTFIRDEDN